MARKSAPPATSLSAIQAQLIVNTPPAVTVSAPDTTELVKAYTDEILPLSKFTITNNQQYVEANALWTKAKGFRSRVEDLFKAAKSAAHQAHKAITSLESQLIAPADQIAAHMQNEILRWQREQERLRREEEARIAEEQRRIAEAEAARIAAERAKAIEELPPWEQEDFLAANPEPAPAAIVEIAPVRLPSAVPTIIGGPSTAKKPWEARLKDFKALVIAAGKRAEAGDESLLEFLDFNQVAANKKARELGADLGKVIPGVEGHQEEILKRA